MALVEATVAARTGDRLEMLEGRWEAVMKVAGRAMAGIVAEPTVLGTRVPAVHPVVEAMTEMAMTEMAEVEMVAEEVMVVAELEGVVVAAGTVEVVASSGS